MEDIHQGCDAIHFMVARMGRLHMRCGKESNGNILRQGRGAIRQGEFTIT